MQVCVVSELRETSHAGLTKWVSLVVLNPVSVPETLDRVEAYYRGKGEETVLLGDTIGVYRGVDHEMTLLELSVVDAV